LGVIVQGGIYNSLVRALQRLGLADTFGESPISILALNVTFPLVPEQIADFCRDKRAVLVLEEGQPEYIEQDILAALRRQGITTPVHGKEMTGAIGEYNAEAIAGGLDRFVTRYMADADLSAGRAGLGANAERRNEVGAILA